MCHLVVITPVSVVFLILVCGLHGFFIFFRVPNIQGPLGPSLYIPSQSKHKNTYLLMIHRIFPISYQDSTWGPRATLHIPSDGGSDHAYTYQYPQPPPKHCACDILKTFWQSELAAVTVEQHWFKGMCHDVSLWYFWGSKQKNHSLCFAIV